MGDDPDSSETVSKSQKKQMMQIDRSNVSVGRRLGMGEQKKSEIGFVLFDFFD